MARILLIEDDEDNVSLLVRLLEHHGHEISVAIDTASGISAAQDETSRPQLILMDLELPSEPDGVPDPNAGLEATRILKSIPGTASIPVIALTAHTMAQHHERISEAGCDDFQEKPIYPFEALLSKIDRWAVAD